MKPSKKLCNEIRAVYDSHLNMTIGELNRLYPMLTRDQIVSILMSEGE